MKKIALSIEQMKRLKELGVDTSDASMAWCKRDGFDNYDFLLPNTEAHVEWGCVVRDEPTFTLQETLNILPKTIKVGYRQYETLCIRWDDYNGAWAMDYRNDSYMSDIDVYICNSDLLEAAYELLCWCAKNGYLRSEERRVGKEC